MAQFAAAIRRRILRRSDVVIFRCGGPIEEPPELVDLKLLRMSSGRGIDLGLVESTMQRAGEVTVDAAMRFAQGHEFFALDGSDGIVAFRWVSFGEDRAGHARLLAGPQRAYLYNGFTLSEHRGRGLTHVLMLHMRKLLAADGRTDLVTGTSANNTSSLRSKRKGGLSEVALIRELIVLHRWRIPLRSIFYTETARELVDGSS